MCKQRANGNGIDNLWLYLSAGLNGRQKVCWTHPWTVAEKTIAGRVGRMGYDRSFIVGAGRWLYLLSPGAS